VSRDSRFKYVGGKEEFQTFTDLDEAVKKDVQLLKDSELIPDDIIISGWIYQVETGKVRSVV